MIYLHDILPKDISDETAYLLTIFMMDLALAVEAHYFGQIMRYGREENTPDSLEFPWKK